MMHHCTKFGENRYNNFCVIAPKTPKMHIFLIEIRKAENFELAFSNWINRNVHREARDVTALIGWQRSTPDPAKALFL